MLKSTKIHFYIPSKAFYTFTKLVFEYLFRSALGAIHNIKFSYLQRLCVESWIYILLGTWYQYSNWNLIYHWGLIYILITPVVIILHNIQTMRSCISQYHFWYFPYGFLEVFGSSNTNLVKFLVKALSIILSLNTWVLVKYCRREKGWCLKCWSYL